MDARDQNAPDLEKHFYYTGKRKLIEALLKKAQLPPNAKILDVGSGTGSDLDVISKFGEVTVLDIDQETLDQVPDTYEKICADLTKINIPENTYDCIIAFDVLEHIEKHDIAAQNLFKILKSGGKLVGSVPAYQCLYSQHDKVLEHFRRYTRTNFTQLLTEAGFKKLSSGYWMSILFPIAAITRIFKKNTQETETDVQILPKPINALFSWILKTEAFVGTSKFFRFPFGLTTWNISTKK